MCWYRVDIQEVWPRLKVLQPFAHEYEDPIFAPSMRQISEAIVGDTWR